MNDGEYKRKTTEREDRYIERALKQNDSLPLKEITNIVNQKVTPILMQVSHLQCLRSAKVLDLKEPRSQDAKCQDAKCLQRENRAIGRGE
jgi:hypothetical protein